MRPPDVLLLFLFSLCVSPSAPSSSSRSLLAIPLSSHRLVLQHARLKRHIEPYGGDAETASQQLHKQRARLLRKKRRRLQQLRGQIREISLVDGRGANDTRRSITGGQRWRKKVLAKMKLIIERLDRLERQLPRRERAGRKAARTRVSIMQKQLAAVAASLNGENGTACAKHGDCRPGRCCHRSSSPSSSSSSLCQPHVLAEGAPCADSCQCGAGLHCYQARENSSAPQCKRPSSSDIRTGAYLHWPSGVFSTQLPVTAATSTATKRREIQKAPTKT